MRDDIIQVINSLESFFRSRKFIFLAANGGDEKAVENEFSYALFKKFKSQGYWVYMQKNRADVMLAQSHPSQIEPEFMLEIGHYTLNQGIVSDDEKFKPFSDITKRQSQGYNNIFHLMIVENVRKTNSKRQFKYGFEKKAGFDDYIEKYESKGLIPEVFPYDDLQAYGYSIDLRLFLVGPISHEQVII